MFELDKDSIMANAAALDETMSSKDTETDQILDESDLKASPKDTSKKASKRKPSKGIAGLKKKLESTSNALNQARRNEEIRKSNTPNVIINHDQIDLEYSANVYGENFSKKQPVVKGELAKCLSPVLEPLIEVMNAAIKGENLRQLKVAHERNNEGKLTKVPLKANGKQTYVTNSIDDLRYIWDQISKNQACMHALMDFQKAYSTLELNTKPGIIKLDDHQNTYNTGSELSEDLGELKSL